MIIPLFIFSIVFFAIIFSLKIIFTVFGIFLPILSFSFGFIFRIFGSIFTLLGIILLVCLIF